MGGGGGGRGRSRTQRRHFAQSRENTWKRNRSERPDANLNGGNSDKNSGEGSNPTWQPFASQNPAFDEYYKVFVCSGAKFVFSFALDAYSSFDGRSKL